MNVIRQILIVFGICLAATVVSGLLPFTLPASVLAILLLALYNGRRGKNPAVNRVMKWLFYIYYPLHLFILGLIQLQIR